ncbi:Protein rolling stone like [Actinidia chinensis var. chinensis]|uniref:Protein rolling stone like n=1 Tax=Actinidia chinensis var. chinensis TaxID=1590841 RepID=A0A2R6RK38_ACTCC|nr:Protein rolling stone like [Actinidia chinensis var. chinensis]
MRILVTSDATTLSYWLNWRVLICAIWVLGPMFIAIYVIWKYERSDHTASEKGTQQERIGLFYDGEAWRPCLKEIHPFWLLAFRVVAFFLLLGTLVSDVVVHGADILYYYTQWTFLLVTVYFGFGSLLSTYGCYQHYKMCKAFNGHDVGIDAEQGLYVPLTYKETTYKVRVEKDLNFQEKNGNLPNADILSRAFQVIFQMSAGAVMLTDCVYWFIIFPFLTIKDYDLNALTFLTHSLNAIVLLGDATLNSLPYPWFRISYFILWTGVYVIFQWVIHAFVPLLWWPYPILDLSGPYAPLWYLVVALMHIPCYGAFALIMKFKHFLLSRLFPQSYQGLR